MQLENAFCFLENGIDRIIWTIRLLDRWTVDPLDGRDMMKQLVTGLAESDQVGQGLSAVGFRVCPMMDPQIGRGVTDTTTERIPGYDGCPDFLPSIGFEVGRISGFFG